MKKVAINGFGRIGRILFRILHKNADIEAQNIHIEAHNMTLGQNAIIEADGRGYPGTATSEPGFGCGEIVTGYNRARFGASHGGKEAPHKARASRAKPPMGTKMLRPPWAVAQTAVEKEEG